MDRLTIALAIIGTAVSVAQLTQALGDFKSVLAAHLLWALLAIVSIWWLLSRSGVSGWLAPRWPYNWPWWGSVPLDLAARIAFRRLDGTGWEGFAIAASKFEADRLDTMATYLMHTVPILGRKPPRAHEIIFGQYHRLICEIRGGAKTLHVPGNVEPVFEDLHIERFRLWRAIEQLRREET